VATKPPVPEEAEVVKPPPKSKKKLIIIIVGVVLLLVLGGGAFLFINKQRADAAALAEEDGGNAASHAPAPSSASKGPPVYLAMDNMVVNLADPGGERVAQVGITFEVIDAGASDSVKAYMPTIRSSVLMLLSQKTSEELLSAEGKQKLIADILREASIPFGGGAEVADPVVTGNKKPKKKPAEPFPVVGVLFSSLIVQ
jgi:flagellar protein FliL